MRRLLVAMVAVGLGWASCAAMADETCAAAAAGKATASKGACLFVCAKCPKVALKAGKCCDADTTAMHVIAVKDGAALCCSCGADCKCTVKDGDASKCNCGKDVKKCALKGMFVCAEGKCAAIGDAAAKCACGKDTVAAK